MTATLTGPRTIHHLAGWETISDDDRRRGGFVTLDRPDECLRLTVRQWLAIIQFASAVGDWRPAGTHAPRVKHPTDGPREHHTPRGSYWPLRQEVEYHDALALAAAFERAWDNLPALIGQTDSPQAFSVTDNRLWQGEEFPDAVVLRHLHDLDVDANRELIRDFLARGAFCISPGLPAELAQESTREREARAQRVALAEERDRLVRLLGAGTITPAEAEPRLDAIRTALSQPTTD